VQFTLLLLALVATVLSANIHPEFLQFMGKYNKVYNNDVEFLKRMEIFKNNMALAAEWSHQGSARFGATEFADMTPEEFAEMYLMPNLPEHVEGPLMDIPDVEAAASLDWRTKGAVTPVKNQGQCGSCWAFSATENLESVNFLATGKLVELAPQQIVDCDKAWYGCSGGWPYGAFQYLISFGGQDTEASYPYTAVNGNCKANLNNVGAKIRSYTSVKAGDENGVKSALQTAPLSICVDASRWYLYQGGVIMGSQCGRSIDHCVQLLGYDDGASTPYWLVRNSWGTSWGENGLLRLQMGQDTCAMADAVTNAVV